jgi:hypothetical protein
VGSRSGVASRDALDIFHICLAVLVDVSSMSSYSLVDIHAVDLDGGRLACFLRMIKFSNLIHSFCLLRALAWLDLGRFSFFPFGFDLRIFSIPTPFFMRAFLHSPTSRPITN